MGTFVAPLSGLESSTGSTQRLSSSFSISNSNLVYQPTTSTSTLPSPWPIGGPEVDTKRRKGHPLTRASGLWSVRPGSAARRQRSQESKRESLKSPKVQGLTFPLWLLSTRLSLSFSSPPSLSLFLSLSFFSIPHPWRGEGVGTVRSHI